jgi:hypothetical protein
VDDATGYRTDTFAVLARVARAAADKAQRSRFREDPIGVVEGFADLPSDVQAMFRSMGEEELAALGRMCDTLTANGYVVEVAGNRNCIF